jgi:hypothetical protein
MAATPAPASAPSFSAPFFWHDKRLQPEQQQQQQQQQHDMFKSSAGCCLCMTLLCMQHTKHSVHVPTGIAAASNDRGYGVTTSIWLALIWLVVTSDLMTMTM